MDYLQYILIFFTYVCYPPRFKPYYKWITFNMVNWYFESWKIGKVLNLIINGLPSIYKNIARLLELL